MTAWRYLAQRLRTGEWLGEVPLGDDVDVVETLSGPGRLTGTVPVEVAGWRVADGRPLLEPWGVGIWAEAAGQIRGGGILVGSAFDGPRWRVDCMGISGYPQGQPYTAAEYVGIRVDPLDVVRYIWWHLQAAPGGNLGVILDSTTSPIRIGTESEDVEFTTGAGEDVRFESGPYRLAWWQTDDLGRIIDDLARQTPFDYLEHTAWDPTGEQLVHRLRLGYPRLGRRRPELRYVIGENVTVRPEVTLDGGDYASEVLALGAGEGRDMVVAGAAVDRGRLRRVAVVTDKAARSRAVAQDRARAALAVRAGATRLTDLEVRNHSHAPIGALAPGDEIQVTGDAGWVHVDQWVRVVQITTHPAKNTQTLTVMRSEEVR